MDGIGAASGDEVEVAAERASELRLASGGDDLKLLDDVHAEDIAGDSGGIVVVGEAIDDEAVGEISLAVDGIPLPYYLGCLGECLGAGGVRRGDTWQQQREVEIVSAFIGEIRDFGLEHGLTDLASIVFDDGRVGSYLDAGLGREFDLQCDVKCGSDGELNLAGVLPESIRECADL